ncbi:MAG TPA: hypothetical protein VGP43_07890 [Chitinophagaceae bacterium]|nr:hypothetical protein [Chitinophagaceae bacterium]
MKKALLGLLVCTLLFAPAMYAQKTQNKNPKAVAQQLYLYWHLKNKKAALKIADKDAVGKLFSVKWRSMKLESFKRRSEGGFECVYRDAKNDLSIAMIVEGGASVGGYNVSSLSFSTEE